MVFRLNIYLYAYYRCIIYVQQAMDALKLKGKKGNLIVKTWERCKSIGRSSKRSAPALRVKSKSWPRIDTRLEEEEEEEEEKRSKKLKRRVAPEGCFSVYVGPQKQRFVIKTEYVNHPLFKLLLEEAESEYGFQSEGPLVLPCRVDVFYRVLLAVDDHDHDHNKEDDFIRRPGCGFGKGYRLLSPSPMIPINHF